MEEIVRERQHLIQEGARLESLLGDPRRKTDLEWREGMIEKIQKVHSQLRRLKQQLRNIR